jgi:hypothetical protein
MSIRKLTLADLENLLKDNNIDPSLYGYYGYSGSKSLDDLLKEINTGECTLMLDENGSLIRAVSSLFVAIQREDEKILIEVRQQRPNAYGFRERNCLLAEKLYEGESMNNGLIRALCEEAPFINTYTFIRSTVDGRSVHSLSYPKLMTKYSDTIVLIKTDSLSEDTYQSEEFNTDGSLRLTTNWKFMSLDEIKEVNPSTFDMISKVI